MTLEDARLELDRIDAELAALFDRRMKVIDNIARIKQGSGAPVHNPQREAQVVSRLMALTGTAYTAELRELYEGIFRISRARQEALMADGRQG